MQLEPGLVIGAKYRLERPLSRGGMGSVWVARHVHLGTALAIKFIDAAYANEPTYVARFEREARIAANLQSPHVVHVQDYGFDHGVPYLVMELLQGEDLNERLKRVGRLPLVQAAQLLTQVGKAIRRAHEAGLVHRDLKPNNLFLARVEDEEVLKVLDFGIVKESGSRITGEVTKTGEVLGSPHYMSPEQIRGDRDVDCRSDLWSLGVILFRAVTGQLPFPGDQLGSVMAKILVDPLPQATALAPDLPPAMDGFFARALSRDRNQRFQSVGEMLEELRRIAGGWGSGTRVSLGSWSGEAGAMAGTAPEAPAGVLPDAEPGATQAPTVPLTPPGAPTPGPAGAGPMSAPDSPTTLTNAGVGKTGRARGAKGSRAPVAIGVGAVVLAVGVGGAMTALRSESPESTATEVEDTRKTAGAEEQTAASAGAASAAAVPASSGSAVSAMEAEPGEVDRGKGEKPEQEQAAGATAVPARSTAATPTAATPRSTTTKETRPQKDPAAGGAATRAAEKKQEPQGPRPGEEKKDWF